jgi:hypothetical protein
MLRPAPATHCLAMALQTMLGLKPGHSATALPGELLKAIAH